MTEYKIQHFIPQWYLRNFSPDYNTEHIDEHIWVYDIDSKNINFEKIYETAQAEYFYGKDGEFERFLSSIDDETSSVIRTIITGKDIRGLAETTRVGIRKFLLLQSSRTEVAKIITNNFVEQHVEEVVKPRLKIKYEESPELIAFIESLKVDANLFEYMMEIGLGNVDTISDLKFILILNETTKPFITSDNPVVKNNYYYKKIPVHGLLTPGLQLICPLSERISLLLIHADLYKFKVNKQSNFKITKESDIDSLNVLQILNCYRQIFSNGNNYEYLHNCCQKALKIKDAFHISRFKREYDDIQERNFQIKFNFLNFNPDTDKISKYAQISKELSIKNPIRDKDLYSKGWTKTEDVIESKMDEYKSQLEKE